MPNAPAVVELLVAAGMVGATVVPINTRFKPRELVHVITNGRLRVLFTTDAIDEHVNFTSLLHEALPGLAESSDATRLELDVAPDLRAVVLVGERGAPGLMAGAALRELAADAASPPPEASAGPDDVAMLLYTSGTTAHPKGCMLSHRAVLLDALGIAERFEIPAGERWWDPLPMFHAGALLLMTACFAAGATFISMPRFDVDEAFALIESEGVNVLYPLFPTITMTLLHDPRFQRLDRSRWRLVVNVGPEDMQRAIAGAYEPAVLMSAYGITELCGTVIFTELDDPLEARVRTCGRPLPGFEIKIVDPETGAELGADERGELVGRGPSRFLGYYRNEDQTRETIDAEGFFHTGDLCSIGADGRISFHGRIKDMLKVGRRERRRRRDRVVPGHAPSGQARPGRGDSGRAADRGAGRIRRTRSRRERHRGGDHRLLQGSDRRLQGAARRAFRRRMADVGDQDPEVPPARGAGGRAPGRWTMTEVKVSLDENLCAASGAVPEAYDACPT